MSSAPTVSRERIRAGSVVSWVSQAGGTRRRKLGVVLAFVPAGVNIREHLPDGWTNHRVQVKRATYVSSVDRYLVEVGGSWWYAPLAGVVEAQNPDPRHPSDRLCFAAVDERALFDLYRTEPVHLHLVLDPRDVDSLAPGFTLVEVRRCDLPSDDAERPDA